jgi:hypothetical protein
MGTRLKYQQLYLIPGEFNIHCLFVYLIQNSPHFQRHKLGIPDIKYVIKLAKLGRSGIIEK